jgi:hypothetical protein
MPTNRRTRPTATTPIPAMSQPRWSPGVAAARSEGSRDSGPADSDEDYRAADAFTDTRPGASARFGHALSLRTASPFWAESPASSLRVVRRHRSRADRDRGRRRAHEDARHVVGTRTSRLGDHCLVGDVEATGRGERGRVGRFLGTTIASTPSTISPATPITRARVSGLDLRAPTRRSVAPRVLASRCRRGGPIRFERPQASLHYRRNRAEVRPPPTIPPTNRLSHAVSQCR